MTHQSPGYDAAGPADAGQQVARLRHVLGLVGQIAGRSAPPPATDALLDENARIISAYSHASTLVQRRFDALAGETAAWATSGIEALLAVGNGGEPPRVAASRLATELETALQRMGKLLGR
jgi:hypothetical protein